MDDECALDCKRSFSLTNLKGFALFVDKSKDCYHRTYNEHIFLDTGIVTDLQDRLSSSFIDLKAVKTATKVELNETRINKIFEDLLMKSSRPEKNSKKLSIPPEISNIKESYNGYWFSAVTARQVLEAMDRGEPHVDISIDLNLSQGRFAISGDELILDGDERLGRVDLRQVESKENRIFFLEDGRLEVLEDRTHGYYKLVPTDQAPLLEISGVKMHIAKGVNPFESAGQMAAQVVRKGARVLDTCSGLGYAASAALKLGACEVISVELSETVMALRRKNPWSQRIFGPGIQLVHADVDDYIRDLPAQSFDAVIHDPPRFSLAGELYGESFYRELCRVLRRGGSLFHYTGNPQLLKRGSGFVDQAAKRLKLAGFTKVEKVSELMGIKAKK